MSPIICDRCDACVCIATGDMAATESPESKGPTDEVFIPTPRLALGRHAALEFAAEEKTLLSTAITAAVEADAQGVQAPEDVASLYLEAGRLLVFVATNKCDERITSACVGLFGCCWAPSSRNTVCSVMQRCLSFAGCKDSPTSSSCGHSF